MVNRFSFFNRLHTYNLFPNIKKGQIEGLDAFIDYWESDAALKDIRWLAYILATVYHETDKTMQPIEEYGKGKGKSYGSKLKYGGGPNKRVPYDIPDKLYYGRGHTQNTWYEIYEKLSKTKRAKDEGWDFLNHPELLLTMRASIWATFHCMILGVYTGRKLAHYFDADSSDWVGARAIVNGSDKAELIAIYSKKFYDCLK